MASSCNSWKGMFLVVHNFSKKKFFFEDLSRISPKSKNICRNSSNDTFWFFFKDFSKNSFEKLFSRKYHKCSIGKIFTFFFQKIFLGCIQNSFTVLSKHYFKDFLTNFAENRLMISRDFLKLVFQELFPHDIFWGFRRKYSKYFPGICLG